MTSENNMELNFDFDSMREWIEEMHESDYHVMPLHDVIDGKCQCYYEECNNQYKHPKFRSWTSMHPPTHNELNNYFNSNMFHKSYGIILGEDDLIVDFDPRNNEDALDQLNAKVGLDLESVCDFVVRTGSGGKHLFFKKPQDLKIRKTLPEVKGIDFLSKGAFVVGVGSFHKSGNQYECPIHAKSDPSKIGQAPESLLAFVEKKEFISDSQYEPFSSSEEELRDALLHIPNHVDTEYDEWLKIGAALSFETDGSSSGYDLWREWSEKSPKHDENMMYMRWNSFKTSRPANPATAGTIFKLAYDNGWEQSFLKDVDLTEFIERAANGGRVVVKKSSSDGEVEETLELKDAPKEVSEIQGVLGDIVEYTLKTAKFPLLMPSLNAAIGVCSVILGRDFRTDMDNYTALYLMSLAETGQGKEHPSQVAEKILSAAGMRNLMKTDVTSKGAIVTELIKSPRGLFFKEEAGHWFQQIGSKNASENKLGEVRAWMDLFSKPNASYTSDSYSQMQHVIKEGADSVESSITVTKPSVSILSVTTPKKLASSINPMMIQDGFLNRFFVLFAHEGWQTMNMDSKRLPVPQSVLAWIEAIERRVKNANRNKMEASRDKYNETLTPIELEFSDGARESIMLHQQKAIEKVKELYQHNLEAMVSRTTEKAMRIALIYELTKDPYAEEISKKTMDWALKLVDFSTDQLVEFIRFEMITSSTEKLYKEAERLLDRAGTKGILHSKLVSEKPFDSCSASTRKDILSYLHEKDILVEHTEPNPSGKGRPKKRYYHSNHVSLEEEKN